MKATLFFETRPTDEANGWIDTSVAEYLEDKITKKSAARDIQNHLDLRLGTSWSYSSNVMPMTSTTFDGQSSVQDGTNAPTTLIFGHKKFKSAPTGVATASVSAVAAAAVGCVIDPHAMPSGFVHPWSLAARQQKAAYEKAYRKPWRPPSTSRYNHPSIASLTIGWLPIHKFRKDLFFNSRMSHENGANPILQANQEANIVPAQGNAMFVKVNKEGLTVGRKINLSLYHGYMPFFHTMQKLFQNFLTAYIEDIDEEDEEEDNSDEFFVLYKDNEGDHILVGDIPWDVFVVSVRRLIIMQNLKEKASDSVGKTNE